MTAESLFAGTEDTKWVEVEGIVNAISVAEKQSWLELDVAVLNDHFTAHIPGYTATNSLPTWLIDARVKLQGVVQTLPNRRGPALGFEMFVPSMDSIDVIRESPKEPFSLPTRAINTVLQADSHTPPGHRVKVHGVVTLQWSDRQIYLQDDTGGIAVELVSPLSLAPGSRLDVIGFPKMSGYSGQSRRNPARHRPEDQGEGSTRRRVRQRPGATRRCFNRDDAAPGRRGSNVAGGAMEFRGVAEDQSSGGRD